MAGAQQQNTQLLSPEVKSAWCRQSTGQQQPQCTPALHNPPGAAPQAPRGQPCTLHSLAIAVHADHQDVRVLSKDAGGALAVVHIPVEEEGSTRGAH